MAQPHLIDGIIRVKNSFNSYTMDTVAQCGYDGLTILDEWYKRRQCEKVVAIRDEAIRALKVLGYEVTDSKSNFMFVKNNKIPAETIAQETAPRMK